MTIQYNPSKFQYEVWLGCLLYSVHRDKEDAVLTIAEYRKMRKVGRA